MNKKKHIQSSVCQGAAAFRRKAGGLLIVVALLYSAFTPPVCGADQVEKELDRVRTAVGYDHMRAWKHGIVLEGTGLALGLESRFHFLFLPDGRFRNEMKSELGMAVGYDGSKGWMVDFSGMPGHIESAALEIAKMRSWVIGGYWLDPACPLKIKLQNGEDDDENEDAMPCLALKIPGGHVRFLLEFDGERALPSKLTWKDVTDMNHVEILRYENAGPEGASFLFPRLLRMQEEGQPSIVRIERILEAPPSSGAACRPVTARPDDTRFNGQVSASAELKRLPSGHLTVRPKVDGRDVGLFLFDTGAGMNVIDQATANRLGMKAVGEYKAVGIGGIVDVKFRIGQTFTLGPVEIQKPHFIEIDLQAIGRMLGIELSGLIGTDFLNRCLAELDIRGEKLFLHPPGAWNDRSEDWQEIVFYNNSPSITGALSNGRKGLFMMDTGAGGATVALNESFISRRELFGDGPVCTGASAGAGGRITTYSGQIPWFEFCGRRIDQLSVTLMVSETGVSELEASAGLIGNRILSRYKVLLDYPGKRMALLDRSL
jgi:hypothetical protein